MKIIKKIAAIMLSVMMVLGMCSVVGAEGAGTTSGSSAANEGKITINNAIEGQTYTIYQILELESFSEKPTTGATNTGNYAYKVATGWEDFITKGEGKDYLEIKDGYVYWRGENNETRAAELAKKALNYANKNKINPSKEPVKATSTNVEFTDLSLGYYLVDSSAGALCSLNTTDTNVTIEEKNAVPSVEKKVKKGSDYDKSNTASIGDKVEFKTTITAQPGAQNYVLHDKMSDGLTFDNSSVEVKKEGDTTALTASSNYELVTDDMEKGDDCTFHIKFTEEFCNSIKTETKIIVTYSATLNEKAVIAGEGNKNETWLKYGNASETTHDTTTTKTYAIPVFKYTNKGTSAVKKPLANAVFTLSKNEDGRDPIELVDITAASDTDKTYQVALESEKSATPKKITTTVTTPSTGKFKIQGLAAGTYYLTETKQPDGYNKLKEAIKIVIAEDGTIKYGSKSKVDTELNKMSADGAVEVENKTGSILPSTGGMGTTLFYIFGAILVVGSGVVLITKKRMK